MRFSQRIGKRPIETALQTEGMNDDLRISLWNVLDIIIWQDDRFENRYAQENIKDFSSSLWFNFFKKPVDTIPQYDFEIIQILRKHFFSASWYDVYDFIEFIIKFFKTRDISTPINIILERELAGYRFISGSFIPVTDKQEIEAINQATKAGPFAGVEAHLISAIDHLSRKQDPDYRNSIKESISAVESLAKEITRNPKATLGDALSTLEKRGDMHPSLKRSLSALYGYTSDEGGIRHAMLEEPELSVADAKFILIACSAFINYMKAKI